MPRASGISNATGRGCQELEIEENMGLTREDAASPAPPSASLVPVQTEGVLVARDNGCSLENATHAAHSMPFSFHGPGPSQLEKVLPSKKKCRDMSFFRILEGRMAKHTIQGGRSSADFLVQLYAAFSDVGESEPTTPAERISTCPAGMPLGWDTDSIEFQTLCSGLCFWELSAAEYVSLDLPYLSFPQIIIDLTHLDSMPYHYYSYTFDQ